MTICWICLPEVRFSRHCSLREQFNYRSKTSRISSNSLASCRRGFLKAVLISLQVFICEVICILFNKAIASIITAFNGISSMLSIKLLLGMLASGTVFSIVCNIWLFFVQGKILPSIRSIECGMFENSFSPVSLGKFISGSFCDIVKTRCDNYSSSFNMVSFPSIFVLIITANDLNVCSLHFFIASQVLFSPYILSDLKLSFIFFPILC